MGFLQIALQNIILPFQRDLKILNCCTILSSFNNAMWLLWNPESLINFSEYYSSRCTILWRDSSKVIFLDNFIGGHL